MNPLAEVKEAVDRIGPCSDAKWTHGRLVKLLKEIGFECQKEVGADYSNGLFTRRGRMDIVARKGTAKVGIEIDRNSPRAKSILKLKGLDLTHRVIVLRSPMKKECPYLQGIDAVFVAGTMRTG